MASSVAYNLLVLAADAALLAVVVRRRGLRLEGRDAVN